MVIATQCNSGVTGGRADRPECHHPGGGGGWHRNKINFCVWIYKQHRTNGVGRRREL